MAEAVVEQAAPAVAGTQQPAATVAPGAEGATEVAQEGAAPVEKPAAVPAPVAEVPKQEPAADPAWEKIQAAYKAGTLKDYMQVVNTDYDAMSDEEVLRADIKKQYPKATDGAINTLLQKRIHTEFDLGSFDEGKNEAGKELLKLEADRIRDGFKAEQQQYVIPTQPQQTTVDPKLQEQQLAEYKELETIVTTHPVLQAFEMNHVIEMGEGTETFKFQVDPSLDKAAIVHPGMALEATFWSEDPTTGKRTFDMATYIKVRNYAANPGKVEAALIAHGKTLGTKAEFDNRHNASSSETSRATPAAGQPVVKVWRG